MLDITCFELQHVMDYVLFFVYLFIYFFVETYFYVSVANFLSYKRSGS